MTQIRTFVDTGVLISAFRGNDDLGTAALSILADSNRDFVTSDLVRLELIPKPTYFERHLELAFYEQFFDVARRIIPSSGTLVREAQAEAELAGLSAIDAIHVAAARRGNCDEFITTERPTKPLFHVDGMQMTTIYISAT